MSNKTTIHWKQWDRPVFVDDTWYQSLHHVPMTLLLELHKANVEGCKRFETSGLVATDLLNAQLRQEFTEAGAEDYPEAYYSKKAMGELQDLLAQWQEGNPSNFWLHDSSIVIDTTGFIESLSSDDLKRIEKRSRF